jgi:DNA-binding NtrC family response regulator
MRVEDFSVLFVDDDMNLLELVNEFLSYKGFKVTTAADGQKGLKLFRENKYDIVISDLSMPNMDGLELLNKIKVESPDSDVIILTAHASIDSAIKALKNGCYDYLQKPIEFERLASLVKRIIEKKRLQNENLMIKRRLKDRYKYDELIGISPRMQEVYHIIDKISMNDPTVLIQGESGTGKSLAAKIIHHNSSRQEGPFIPINCGAIPENLLESELFGHIKGAFTGAYKDNPGLFRAADGGTIFLDEIAEAPSHIQVKLLRALQEKTIKPVGDFRESRVNVRVIAATNKELEKEMKKGAFRQDLYYRLNVIAIRMPSLRDSKEDIPFLIDHFNKKYGVKNRIKKLSISSEAMELLLNYHWPGNVRELENFIERAFALGMDKTIKVSDLPPEIARGSQFPDCDNESLNLEKNESDLIKKALLKTNGNKGEAARVLGINISTVYRKMQKYKIADLSLE